MNGWFAFERRWLSLLFTGMIPGSTTWPAFGEVDIARFQAQWAAAAPGAARFGLRAAVWLLQFIGPWLQGRVLPFSLQPEDVQTSVLAGAEHSRIYLLRQLVLVVKTVACMAYFQDPANQQRARAL